MLNGVFLSHGPICIMTRGVMDGVQRDIVWRRVKCCEVVKVEVCPH